jgi:2-hydroxymethylglutarate dehydrogenase
MSVGFVGIGNMGLPMARNILRAGHELIVWDVRPAATRELEQIGAARARSLPELASSVRTTFLSLPDEGVVNEVVCGPSGLLEGSRTGDAIFDFSTVSPASTLRLAEKAAEFGVRVIDTPVTGSVTAAHAGTLTLMIGATKEIVEPYEPLLKSVGTTLLYLNEVGLGNTLKLLNNLVSLSNQAALCEALALADRLAVPRRLVGEVLSKGSADSFILDRKLDDMVNHDYRAGFFIDLAYKDLGLVLDLAKTVSARLDVVREVRKLYEDAANAGFGGLDGSGILSVLEPPNN